MQFLRASTMGSHNDVEKKSTDTHIGVVDEFDTPEDRRLLRKVDFRLLPILTLLYLLSFLDRSNVGNAKIDGLTTDINLKGAAYNTALALYFIAYVVFEIPANIILKRFDPQFWLPILTCSWGIVSVCQGLVTNQAQFFAIRFLLGVTEAGLFPGVIFVFSLYYRRRERHWRVAFFFGGAALAGAFGGIFAYAIAKMNGVGGKRGWAWIFILEGFLTIAVSLGAFFIVPTWSYKAKFLTDSERERLLARLQSDSDAGKHEQFKWNYVWQALTDRFCWGYSFLFHGFAFVLYSLSLFMPTIIANLGFQTWKAQLMTVPPNALAAVAIWITAWLSTKYNTKAPFILSSILIALIGYIILIASHSAGPQYAGVHLAAVGVYSGCALIFSWPGDNVSGQTKRAVSVAMQITIGDIGAVVGVLIYRPDFAKNHYRKPHIIAIGYLLFAAASVGYLWYFLNKENKRKEVLLSERKAEGLGSVEDDEERLRLGDWHITHRYIM